MLPAVCLLVIVASISAISQSSSRITGIVEPEELMSQPKKLPPSPPELDLQFIAIMKAYKDDAESARAIRPQLDEFLRVHPNYSNAYAIRAVDDLTILQNTNYQNIISDINLAIAALPAETQLTMFDRGDLFSLRAKAQYQMGRFKEAIDDFEVAIKAKPESAKNLFFSKGIEPENVDSLVWGMNHFDNLVQRFPMDYRPRLYRGLYLSFFVTFDEKYRQQAVAEFQKAIVINPRAALPHYFLGNLFSPGIRVFTESARSEAWKKAIPEYAAAIALDAKMLPAFRERANAYYQLKQSILAISDYNRAIELDPEYSGAYNDRGLAKMDLGQFLSAIGDFGDAITKDKNPDDFFSKFHYENRADARIKIADYIPAAADLTKAIELTLANNTFLMNVETFKAIFPEYKKVSDEALFRKIQSLYYPQLTNEDVMKQMKGNSDFIDTLLADLYLKRADTYLKAGNYRKASTDYNRVFNGFGEYGKASDRWRPMGTNSSGESFVDARTIDLSGNGIARIWLKTVSANKATYSVDAYEIDCGSRRINEESTVLYNSDGKVIKSSDSIVNWQRIVPDTIGEQLYFGLCAN